MATYVATSFRSGISARTARSWSLTGSRIGAWDGVTTGIRCTRCAPAAGANSATRSSAGSVPVSTTWSMLLTFASHADSPNPPRELRLLHAAGGLVVFVSVVVPADMTLPDAHELASRLEDEIREGQPHMQDVVVHTEP
jgi:hypothetical protein